MPIHRQRIFVNKNFKNAQVEMVANRSHWRQWYHVANAFHNKVSVKSYADVLKSTKSVTCSKTYPVQSPQLRTTVPKIEVHSIKNSRAETTKKSKPSKATMSLLTEIEPLVLANRFQVLQQEECPSKLVVSHSGDSLATAKKFPFVGNKNGKGSKLGQAVKVECSGIHFKGNKNKTGNKLGHYSTATDKVDECDLNGAIVQDTKQMATIDESLNSPATSSSKLIAIPVPMNTNVNKMDCKGTEGEKSLNNDNEIPLSCEQSLSCDLGDDITHVTKHRKKFIPETVKWEQIHSKDYNRCIYQNKARFGFIPYNDLLLYTGEDVVWGEVPNMIEAHSIIRKSGLPNYLCMRIPVSSQLNIPIWKEHLASYWDQQLLDLLQYGFPLDFDRSILLKSTEVNHKSAIEFQEHVSKYIAEELKYGAMYGPFQEKPFPCHVSPFLTRHKPDSDNRRVIVDLSYPDGHSVNDGVAKDKYLNTYFDLNYPSVDNIVEKLKTLGDSALIFKIDITRAFRHLRIDPGDLDLLALKHGSYYIDGTLAFGFRHGSVFFQRCTDAIRYIMDQKFGYPNLYNYIDDLIYPALPHEIHGAYTTLKHLLSDLGLEVSQKKLIPPTSKAICLGIEIDVLNKTLAIPPQKFEEIINMCNMWAPKTRATKNQLQSLLGSLLYITKCVKPARYFLNRMLQLLRTNHTAKIISLNNDFKRDLNWFLTFLRQYNGVTFYDNQEIQETIFLDASLQGLGGAFNNEVYALTIPLGFQNYDIVHLEILNIVVALKLWAKQWQNKRIEIRCDNMAVVEVIRSGKARDPTLAKCARNIWLLTSIFNIYLVVNHIPGQRNTLADLLSRWTGSINNFLKLQELLPQFSWIPIHIDITKLNDSI